MRDEDIALLKPSAFDRTPKYLQIARNLELLIREKRWCADEALMPERQLAEVLGVSRVTMRGALTVLETRGRIDRRTGSGTYLRALHSVAPPAQQLSDGNTTKSAADSHYVWLLRELGVTGASECSALALAPGSQIARLRRLHYKNAIPISIEFSRVPARILNEPMRVESSLYETLGEQGHFVFRALQKFSAVLAEKEHAKLLNVDVRFPLLLISRIGYDRNGCAIEFSETFFRSDLQDVTTDSLQGFCA
jgi:GntR family transcriptional regulator